MPVRETARRSVDRARPDPAVIDEAAALLQRGGLVAFPTETVYGLGAHALDPSAVAAMFAAKERPATDPVIVHIADASGLAQLARAVPTAAQALADRFWPGPLTIIVLKQPTVPPGITAGLDTVAVRVPAHPVALALLRRSALPIAAPSANRFSRPSPTSAAHVLLDLDGRIDMVLDGGATDIGVESTIVDCTVSPPVVRRAGGVPFEQLLEVVPSLRVVHLAGDVDQAQPAPGQLLRHYAPAARLTAYRGEVAAVAARLAAEARAGTASGLRVGVLAPEEHLRALAPVIAAAAARGRIAVQSLGRRQDPASAAKALYGALRALDAEPVDVILAAGPDHDGLGAAVWDRLGRAAEGRVVTV